MKKYNFNAGPSMLPREVIEKTAQQCLDFNGSGLSLMEISHRAKDFQPVVDEAVALVKELLDIPEGYSVIFLGGGASLEFCMIPFNFLIKKAAYLNTGVRAKKAMKEAKLFGEVVEVASSADANPSHAFHSRMSVSCATSSASSSEAKNDWPIAIALPRNWGANLMNSVCSIHLYNVGERAMSSNIKGF